MKGKRSKINCKLFPKIYKKIGIVALIAFTIYIVIKTVQTQKRKKMEGFNEGRRKISQREDSSPSEEKKEKENKNNSSSSDSGSGSGSTVIINA
jgi:hypothetical protein